MSDGEAGQEYKRCAVCDAFIFRRSPNGSLICWKTWERKRACGPSCAARYRWEQRQMQEATAK